MKKEQIRVTLKTLGLRTHQGVYHSYNSKYYAVQLQMKVGNRRK
jgi:ribosomal protein L30/L7E